jgi:ABC-2 type transport system ATP-binding protein
MDSGQVIACDTPAGLIRALPLDAVVSATVVAGGPQPITVDDLTQIPGVTRATIATEQVPPTIKAQTNDVQATIVGLLQLAGDRQITLGELTSTRANLEDVFLSLTGRSYEQHDANPEDDEAAPKKRRRGR